MITFTSSGSFKNTDNFLKTMLKNDIPSKLKGVAKEGVIALAAATPTESGETARSWAYEIVQSRDTWSIFWTNSHIDDGVKIAVILQYGHGTGGGGYVAGRDYINPALKPIFDKITEKAWKAVTTA